MNVGGTRWRYGLVLAAAGACLASPQATAPADAARTATVRVHANAFDPVEVAVDEGGTVRWVVEEGGHTIVADDQRFAFRGERGAPLPVGAVVTYEAGATGYVGYYCEIHGGPGLAGMAGRIRVGDPPAPTAPPQRVTRVPDDEPSVAAALRRARPGDRIELAPGEHPVETTVLAGVDDVTLAGASARPSGVRLVARATSSGLPEIGVRVTGDGVAIRNLTLIGFRRAGIAVEDADRTTIERVVVDGAGTTLDGVVGERVRGLTIRDVLAKGSRRAGVRISDCRACGTLLTRTATHGNLVGVLVDAARGVIVRRADVTGNAAGIIAKGRTGGGRPVVVAVVASRIVDNVERGPVRTARQEDRALATGAGVWLDAASDSRVTGNTVRGNGYGVVVSGGASTRTGVTDNRLDGNLDADLAWDGAGTDVCFRTPDGARDTSDPPAITALYPCHRPTVGVPYPLVAMRLAYRALAS